MGTIVTVCPAHVGTPTVEKRVEGGVPVAGDRSGDALSALGCSSSFTELEAEHVGAVDSAAPVSGVVGCAPGSANDGEVYLALGAGAPPARGPALLRLSRAHRRVSLCGLYVLPAYLASFNFWWGIFDHAESGLQCRSITTCLFYW